MSETEMNGIAVLEIPPPPGQRVVFFPEFSNFRIVLSIPGDLPVDAQEKIGRKLFRMRTCFDSLSNSGVVFSGKAGPVNFPYTNRPTLFINPAYKFSKTLRK